MIGAMTSASNVFDTATSVTPAGSRDASRQARAISWRTAARPVWQGWGVMFIHNTRAESAKPGSAGFCRTHTIVESSGRGLPLRLHVLARFVEMDVLGDVVHPIRRDQVMRAAGLGILPGQLDLVGTFQVIHGSDMLAVGTQDFHVFLNVPLIKHVDASVSYIGQRIRRFAGSETIQRELRPRPNPGPPVGKSGF